MSKEDKTPSPLRAAFQEIINKKEYPDVAPSGYEYGLDAEVEGYDFFVEAKTGCHVLTKPVKIAHVGDVPRALVFFYCPLEGIKIVVQGRFPPKAPVTQLPPDKFESCEAIMKNFAASESDEVDEEHAYYCVPMLVPIPLLASPDGVDDEKDVAILIYARRGMSCFMWAISEGNKEGCSSVLEQNGADVLKARFHNGLNALTFAATFGHAHIVKLFLENGADAKWLLPGPELTTMMILAIGYMKNKDDEDVMAKADYKECAKLLKNAGCDMTLKNKGDDTVLEMAKEMKSDFLIELFSNL